jgi:hypothetical protein
MSFVVVIKGPEAKAGLMPSLSNTKGVEVPMKEASITTQTSEMATTEPNSKLFFHT